MWFTYRYGILLASSISSLLERYAPALNVASPAISEQLSRKNGPKLGDLSLDQVAACPSMYRSMLPTSTWGSGICR
jgi:hypothetical protein